MTPAESAGRGYDELYEQFQSPLMKQVRREAYGEDIGQHSWVTAGELREDVSRLRLTGSSRILDLGCGPCGPLLFVMGLAGCRGAAADVSAPALAAGRARAASLDLSRSIDLCRADLDQQLPFAAGVFDAVMSLDVILHLRDRASAFREAARVLVPGGRFLFTDAGVITGSISSEELQARAIHGHTRFVPPGFNERMLALAGFSLIEAEDRTEASANNAAGRLGARLAHRAELELLEGNAVFERQQRYLETVIALSRGGALSRMMYLAEVRPGGFGETTDKGRKGSP